MLIRTFCKRCWRPGGLHRCLFLLMEDQLIWYISHCLQGFYTSQVVGNGISEASNSMMVGFDIWLENQRRMRVKVPSWRRRVFFWVFFDICGMSDLDIEKSPPCYQAGAYDLWLVVINPNSCLWKTHFCLFLRSFFFWCLFFFFCNRENEKNGLDTRNCKHDDLSNETSLVV